MELCGPRPQVVLHLLLRRPRGPRAVHRPPIPVLRRERAVPPPSAEKRSILFVLRFFHRLYPLRGAEGVRPEPAPGGEASPAADGCAACCRFRPRCHIGGSLSQTEIGRAHV